MTDTPQDDGIVRRMRKDVALMVGSTAAVILLYVTLFFIAGMTDRVTRYVCPRTRVKVGVIRSEPVQVVFYPAFFMESFFTKRVFLTEFANKDGRIIDYHNERYRLTGQTEIGQ